MPPSEIRDTTLRQLRETFLVMTSAEWDLELLGKPKNVVDAAAKNLLRVSSARLRLANAKLADIRDSLIENEEDLEQGRKQVSKSLSKLNDVKAVLDAVSSFLGIVGRVIALF